MIEARECGRGTAAAILLHYLCPKSNPHGFGIDEITAGRCFSVMQNGHAIGAYVLQGHGPEVWIQAAAGSANLDLCDLFDELTRKHGAGFRSIAFKTYRRGLVKKAQERGYVVVSTDDGYTMRKFLT